MRKFILYGLVGLAIVGLMSQLLFNPSQLIKTIAFVAFGAVVIFFVFRLLFKQRFNSDEMRKYRQAAKQSRLKYQNKSSTKQQQSYRKPLRRRASHLRVIDGNKHK